MSKKDRDSTFLYALTQFETIEANLSKLERLWSEMSSYIPDGMTFGYHEDYENRRRSYLKILKSMPAIDGWKLDTEPVEYNWIGHQRYADMEYGDGDAENIIATNLRIHAPEGELQEYRFRFNEKRRELIRNAVNDLVVKIEESLKYIGERLGPPQERIESVKDHHWSELDEQVRQIDTLLGSSIERPSRWSDLQRHLYYGTKGDFNDIVQHDWPSIKNELIIKLHGPNEPLPVEVDDLSHLIGNELKGPIPTKLHWNRLSPNDFERLIFTLISTEGGTYENPEWLMTTNAPDRGRDLSVVRVLHDSLTGTTRLRIIIQCKHWLQRSVNPSDISTKEQIRLWEPPRVDICIIATSGRFTADAVAVVEKHNQSDQALRFEMWSDSHLEKLIARRPALIAEFGLR